MVYMFSTSYAIFFRLFRHHSFQMCRNSVVSRIITFNLYLGLNSEHVEILYRTNKQ